MKPTIKTTQKSREILNLKLRDLIESVARGSGLAIISSEAEDDQGKKVQFIVLTYVDEPDRVRAFHNQLNQMIDSMKR